MMYIVWACACLNVCAHVSKTYACSDLKYTLTSVYVCVYVCMCVHVCVHASAVSNVHVRTLCVQAYMYLHSTQGFPISLQDVLHS